LYSKDLTTSERITASALQDPSRGSDTIVAYNLNYWRVYGLTPHINLVREGDGEIQSVLDDIVVFRTDDLINIEKLAGGRVGSVPVSRKSKHSRVGELAGKNRLYVDIFGEERIINLNGTQSQRIHPPQGWGLRSHSWSSDGGRMLFDNYTRTVSVLQKATETFVAWATLGLGAPPEESNGEIIRVVDTTTGNTCFSWDSPGKFIGREGQHNADISPNGREVAVMTSDSLTIYAVPTWCAGK
jgi:hypothetical protein